MIECPYCQTPHIHNTIFCSECGNYMLKDQSPETDPLNRIAANPESGAVNQRPAASRHLGSASYAIRLKIGARKREIELPLNKVIHVGRVDPAATVFPEIDLTDDGASARTVSRRHARILKEGDSVIVEDLGSVNGTFVNGERLVPYLPETLRDGDTLQVGQLMIDVKIQYH